MPFTCIVYHKNKFETFVPTLIHSAKMNNILSSRCEITLLISSTEDLITGLTNRIRGLEDMLDNDVPEEKRTEIEADLIEIKDQLDKNKELLSKLHKENTKSFVAAGCIAFLLALVYIVYTMTIYR